ncbi:BTB/POZ domain containing protein [Tritrichomonas foetus]|uniref:BTB/POZ domain containing protein n=1 Tax=Tritrichomonas foetus TaxID=1144522 RepID=A0A1J4K0Y5_9EUKA|nr:BTB/POZ domain containing protein [Tritrichomonas foetus]|eukprot:OHT05089.1 BTB/POZ domain containing protein [Tritrichomonas foetus]
MNRPDNPDIIINSSDNHKFSLHSPILQLRWPLFKRDPNEAKRKLSLLDSSSITAIIEYIYAGLPAQDNMKINFRNAEVPFPPSDPSSQYKSDMLRLFTSHIGSDFIVECHGERFQVHKFVLATRCGYFSSLFCSGMSECKSGIYYDAFCDSSMHMKQFLEYVYSGDTRLVTVDDCMSLVGLTKSFYFHENYEGEVEEYVMAEILRSHMSQINEVQSKARSKNFDKMLDLIDACETF